MKLVKKLLPLMLMGASVASQADPITYTMIVDGVTGVANAVAVGPNATTTMVINADTANVTSQTIGGNPGHCVKGDTGTIAITGINGGAAQALAGNFYVCATNVGDNVGVYSTAGGAPVHGGNGGVGTGLLTGSPAVDLISNIGPVSYVANTIHSHSATLTLAAGGTYSASAPEQTIVANTTASTFQAVTSGAFVPPFALAPSVLGNTLPKPLDLSKTNGPALTSCLTTSLQQLFGGSVTYLGENSFGQTSISWNGQIISFFPLSANASSSLPPVLKLQASNTLSVVTGCGTLSLAPAPFNVNGLATSLNTMGLAANYSQSGVITVNVNGTIYVARPDFFVTKSSSSTAGISQGANGAYQFTDSNGNTQVLHPAFLDTSALVNALGGSVAIQADGTAIQTVNGQRWLLVPDATLASVPASHIVDFSTWQDGTNHFSYRILNVQPNPSNLVQPTYSQGYTITALQ